MSKRIKYLKEYMDIYRFISYFYQIDLVRKLKIKSVLEVGVGNKFVSEYLKKEGLYVNTCDIDKSLNPDYVGDIRKMSSFITKKYDVVVACEILEHIPFDNVQTALMEIYEASKKYVVLSIPYSSARFEIIFNLSILKRFTQNFLFRLPYFFKDIKFNGEHYWEMGRKDYSISKIRKTLEKYFIITKEITPLLNSYHYFFVLKKKKLIKCKSCLSYDDIKVGNFIKWNYCNLCGYGWKDEKK
jgi:SAM-dependent methyltransferase